MKRLFFWILILVAVFGAVKAIQLVVKLAQQMPPAKLPTQPSRSPFANSIGARGLVESVDENVRIAPAVAGLVTEVPVQVGVEVKPGDVLVKQDTRDTSAVIVAQAFYIGFSLTGEASARPDVGEAVVSSHPTGAQVRVDGRLQGTTPLVMPLDEAQPACLFGGRIVRHLLAHGVVRRHL